MDYGLVKKLDTDFETAEQRVRDALAAEGFGVLSVIDVQQAFKQKLELDYRPYRILGACNPGLAHRALESEPHLGLLLPCNVVVQAAPDGDGTLVSVATPDAMFARVENPDVHAVGDEAAQRLQRVMEAL
ncbi:MAG: DUF302 domain-containing protein [Ectothiorhodospiraceae bacterium]|nr:DUF302 domain-containing protein [Ectothiorhodospiraceae bacterium]